jgi:hypothetical protein
MEGIGGKVGSSGSDREEVVAVKEQARVSGKTSVSRLSVDEALEALGVEVDVLKEHIKANTIPEERDEHGRVWVLVGASSNVPNPEHNRCRTPRDEALIGNLEAQNSDLRATHKLPEGLEEPPGALEVPKRRAPLEHTRRRRPP